MIFTPGARYEHGTFGTAGGAVTACRRIVQSGLADYAKKNSGIAAADSTSFT